MSSKLSLGKILFSSLIFMLLMLCCTSLEAARNRPIYEEDKSVLLREILDSLDNLRFEINNHETELRMFEEKFKNQEDILESLRNQTTIALQVVKETLKSQSSSLESKLTNHENSAKGLSNDLKSYTQDHNQS